MSLALEELPGSISPEGKIRLGLLPATVCVHNPVPAEYATQVPSVAMGFPKPACVAVVNCVLFAISTVEYCACAVEAQSDSAARAARREATGTAERRWKSTAAARCMAVLWAGGVRLAVGTAVARF